MTEITDASATFVGSEVFWFLRLRSGGGMSPNENRKMEQTRSHKIIKIERHRKCYGEGMKNPLLEFVLKIGDVNVAESFIIGVDVDVSERAELPGDILVDAEIV